MHVERIGDAPSAVGADLRAALSACGPGCAQVGGIAVIGPTVADDVIDAILVLPAGVVVAVGVDLPDPAMRVDAPLTEPWSVDGWVLRRADGPVNPVPEARATTAAVRDLLTGVCPEVPVGTMIAVGPFADRVVQPDDERGADVRVLHPSRVNLTDALPRASRVVVTRWRAELLLRTLGCPDQDAELLAREGFPQSAPGAATASTTDLDTPPHGIALGAGRVWAPDTTHPPSPILDPEATGPMPVVRHRDRWWRVAAWPAAGALLALLLSLAVAATLPDSDDADPAQVSTSTPGS